MKKYNVIPATKPLSPKKQRLEEIKEACFISNLNAYMSMHGADEHYAIKNNRILPFNSSDLLTISEFNKIRKRELVFKYILWVAVFACLFFVDTDSIVFKILLALVPS